MAKTIEQSFRDYKTNLEITDRQASLVSTRRANVVKAIRRELSLHPEESKVTGSWDRDTLTRYLSEGDVDVMVILHYGKHKDWDNSAGATSCLDRFRAILVKEYPYTTIRRDQNCITMKFSEFRLDVVPAFKVGESDYQIPDSIDKRWIPTNPFTFAEKITEVNKAMAYTFKPLIKMVKGWNRDKGWPIRSFHLECLMYNHFRSYTQAYSYPYMLKEFFQALPGALAVACYEPVKYERVDTYLDNNAIRTKRDITKEKATDAKAKSKEAYDDQTTYSSNISISIGEWKRLLGEFFPTYE